ncbi:MAG: hypothetical protein ABI041_07990 [Bdellovibrionia bacterium]
MFFDNHRPDNLFDHLCSSHLLTAVRVLGPDSAACYEMQLREMETLGLGQLQQMKQWRLEERGLVLNWDG